MARPKVQEHPAGLTAEQAGEADIDQLYGSFVDGIENITDHHRHQPMARLATRNILVLTDEIAMELPPHELFVFNALARNR